MIDDGYAPDVEYGYCGELSEKVIRDIFNLRACFLESYFNLNGWDIAYITDNCKGYRKGNSAVLRIYDSYPYDDWDDYLMNTVKNIAKIEGKPINEIVDSIYKAEHEVCITYIRDINKLVICQTSEDLYYVRKYVKDKVETNLELKRLGWIK